MKFLKLIALSATILSTFVSASEIQITSQKQVLSQNNKVRTYSGDVQLSFSGAYETKSQLQTVKMVNGEKVLSGNVEIHFQNFIAKTDKAIFTVVDKETIVKMDSVKLIYK